MSDEQNIEQPTEAPEEPENIWGMLGLEDPDKNDYAEESNDAEEDAAKEDKLEKKLTSRMSDMQKKFDQTILRERVGKFQDAADDLEKDLFKAIAGDVHDPATFDRAIGLVKKQAATMREGAEKYKVQAEEQAKQEAARAWGTGPVGVANPKGKDYEAERDKQIAAGDTKALTDYLLEAFVVE